MKTSQTEAQSDKNVKQVAKKISSQIKSLVFSQKTIEEIIEYLEKQYSSYKNFTYAGHGFFSLILKATKSNNEWIALKIVLVKENIQEIESIKKEYEFLKQMNKSLYFVGVNSCFYLRNEDDDAEEKYFVIEMELCLQNLAQILQEYRTAKNQLSDRVKEILAIQMIDALNMLHKKEIIHRDIKPDNILISKNLSFKDIPFIIKLSDLGLASQLKEQQQSYLSGKLGTPNYMSSEASERKWRKQSDLFSLGIVLLELDNYLTFQFSKLKMKEIIALQEEGISALLKYELNRKSNIFSIAEIFLNPNYKERKSAIEILEGFLKKEEYKNIPVYSIITNFALSAKPSLEIPHYTDRNKDQKELIFSQVSNFLKKNEKESSSKLDTERFRSIMKKQKIQTHIDEIQQECFISHDNLKYALRALEEQKKFTQFSYLGRGASGIVFQVKNLVKNRDSVIKLSLGRNKVGILREVAILKKVQSAYIVKFYDFEFFQDRNQFQYVWFEFERCKCTLSHYLNAHKEDIANNPDLKIEFALQMIDSVNSLHLSGILHGDLKLDNFLIYEDEFGNEIIKLSDFDQSSLLQKFKYELKEGDDLQSDKGYLFAEENCFYQREKQGTLVFTSPERYYCNDCPSSFLSDSFSVGLCLLLLDNYISLDKIFVKNYCNLLKPYSIPFEDKNHLINTNSQIYKWAIPLLQYNPYRRLFLKDIIDQIVESPIPLYSKIISNTPIKAIYVQAHCLHLKGIQFNEIIKFLKNNSSQLQKTLKLLAIDLNKQQIQSEGMIKFALFLSELTLLSSLTLDLGNNNIQNEGTTLLSTNISKLISLSSLSLNLSNNSIQNEGIIQLSSFIHQWNNSIQRDGIEELSSCILQLKQLSSLSLNLNNNQIQRGAIIKLSFSISQLTQLSQLQLNFFNSQIHKDGIDQLIMNISKLQQLSQLSLNLGQNSISNERMKPLSQCLQKLTELSSLILELKNNEIQSLGALELSLGLSKFSQLTSLTLDFNNNKIQSQGTSTLSESLSTLSLLSSLNLNFSNSNICGEGIIQLVSLYHQWNDSIQKDSMQELSSCLTKLVSLSSLILNLNYNQIESKGIIQLSKGISTQTSLQSLVLNLLNNEICCEGITQFSQSISKLISLCSLTLNLDLNKIKDNGIIQLSLALSQLKDISSLSLSLNYNKIQNDGARKLVLNLSKLKELSLFKLYLTNNLIETEPKGALKDQIESYFSREQKILIVL